MTTLRDIITADGTVHWRDNAGDVWDADNILDQWGDALDREASCVDGAIQYIGEDGYITGGDAALVQIPAWERPLSYPYEGFDGDGNSHWYATWRDVSGGIDAFTDGFLGATEEQNHETIQTWAHDGLTAIANILDCRMSPEFPPEAYQRWAQERLAPENNAVRS